MIDYTQGVRDEEEEQRKTDKRRGMRDYTQGVRDEEEEQRKRDKG